MPEDTWELVEKPWKLRGEVHCGLSPRARSSCCRESEVTGLRPSLTYQALPEVLVMSWEERF